MSMMSSYPAMMAAYGGQPPQQPQQQNMRYGNPAQMNLQTGMGSTGFGQFNQMRPPMQPMGQPGGQQGGSSFASQFPALLAAYQSRQQGGAPGAFNGAPPAQRMPNFNPNQSYQSAIGMGMRPQQTMSSGTNFAAGAGGQNPYLAGIIARAATGAPQQMGGAGASPMPFRGGFAGAG